MALQATVRGRRVPPVCPSSVVQPGTPGDSMGRGGMMNPRGIKATGGNSASYLEFPSPLPTGSSPVLLRWLDAADLPPG
ncbi:hypothetical protein D7V80_07320 [Corallococcus sp. CA054B]|nr:hypothetical protein D7V80_07320 [Corallococcus sp. CA054B]